MLGYIVYIDNKIIRLDIILYKKSNMSRAKTLFNVSISISIRETSTTSLE